MRSSPFRPRLVEERHASAAVGNADSDRGADIGCCWSRACVAKVNGATGAQRPHGRRLPTMAHSGGGSNAPQNAAQAARSTGSMPASSRPPPAGRRWRRRQSRCWCSTAHRPDRVNGNNTPLPMASVAKLFIADDLLLQASNGPDQLSPDDRNAFDSCCGPPTTAPPKCSGTAAAAAPSSTRRRARYGLDRYDGAVQRGRGASRSAPQAISSATTTSCSTAGVGCRRPGGRDHRRPVAIRPGQASTDIRSGSASPTACTPNRLRSSRAGSAARRRPDAHVHRRDRRRPPLRDGRSARCSRTVTTRPPATPSPRRSRRCSRPAASTRS